MEKLRPPTKGILDARGVIVDDGKASSGTGAEISTVYCETPLSESHERMTGRIEIGSGRAVASFPATAEQRISELNRSRGGTTRLGLRANPISRASTPA